MSKKVLLASLLHETNSFNQILTQEDAFLGRFLHWQDQTARVALAGSGTEMGGFIAAAEAYGWQSQIALAAAAGPSGPMEEGLFQRFKDKILAQAREFAPDGVLLALHGAMTTELSADPEGDLAQDLRKLVGPGVPIVVTLDMHANLSPRLIDAVDGICIYETYPHIDQAQTGERAAQALKRLMAGTQRPQAYCLRLPMLDAADHGRTSPPGPMNQIMARLEALREQHDLVTGAIAIGFTWADTPNAGPAVVLYAMPQVALATIAAELGAALWASRLETTLHSPSPAEALARLDAPGEGPLVIADFADNPAGGAYGDSPNLLREILAAKVENAVFATLFDPENAAKAARAGVGAELTLDLGGKYAPEICPPLTLTVTVSALHNGEIPFEGPYLRGVTVNMGQMAVLTYAGVEIVLASRALAITDLQQLRVLGIEPTAKRLIALKSRNHHRAAYGPIAREVVLTDAGGIASTDFAAIEYRNLSRPIWPLDSSAGPNFFRVLEYRRNV